MRRILTLRMPCTIDAEVLKPYRKEHRILYRLEGSDVVLAIYKLSTYESSLQGIELCLDFYVPACLTKRGFTASSVPASSYVTRKYGIHQTVDTEAYRKAWRALNSHYYAYPPTATRLHSTLIG